MDPVSEDPSSATDTPEVVEVKPEPVQFDAKDVLHLTARFDALQRINHRNRLAEEKIDTINNIRAMLSNERRNGGTSSLACGLNSLQRFMSSVQSAAFSDRCAAAQDASVVFSMVCKQRPPEEERFLAIPKKETLNRTDKPERATLVKEKPCLSKPNPPPLPPPPPQPLQLIPEPVVSEVEETPDTSLAVNRGKRRAVVNPSPNTPVPASEKQPETKKAKKENGSTTPAAKKRTSNRLSKTPRVNTKEIDEPTYCFCNRVSFGEMIGCDNDKCEIEWFHFECIGLNSKPKGKWYCPNCRHPESARMQKGPSKKDNKNEKRGEEE